jgi:hypothetical protein
MNTASVATRLLAAAVGLMSGASTGAWAQDALSIANNDSVNIDATTFKVAPGNAKGDLSAQINKLVARELGAGAIVFRASDRLYIIEADANLKMVLAYDPARPYAYDPGDARRFMYDQHSDPRRFAVDPARPYAYDPGDARRFMYDQHSDPRRFAVDPARPYAYDPGDARRFAVDPNDRRCTAAYQNDPRCPADQQSERRHLCQRPRLAQYRLKKAFDENWAATSTKK